MNIILNETLWAKSAIERSDLGKDPYETLKRVARYYFDSGYSKDQVKMLLDGFLVSCDPSVSAVKWAQTTGSAISYASKHDAINIGKVVITEAEIDKIRSAGVGRMAERLAFALLCLSKYWSVCSAGDSGWVYNNDSDIMKMANIKTSIKRQCMLYNDLVECGLISLPYKIDCMNVKVNFITTDSPAAIEITDFRNLGNQYLMYIGEPFFKCAECGAVEKRNTVSRGRKQKYCTNCAAQVKTRQSVEAVIRSRMRA